MSTTTIPTPPQEKSKKEEPASIKRRLAEKYNSYLSAQGFRSEIDRDGDVTFITEGQTFYILIDPSDQTYFRVTIPSFWTPDDPQKLQSVLPLVNEVSAGVKGVKVVSRQGSIWAFCEMFLPQPDDYQAIIRRMILSLQYAARVFGDRVAAGKVESS